MKIDDLLNKLDDMVDSAWGLPLSGGRCVLDADKVRDVIDDLRLNLPKEIPQAKAIVADRVEIIKNAKEEAAEIIKKAEDKARFLVTEDEIVKQAQEKANVILKEARQKSKEVKMAAVEFSDHLLNQSEETVASALSELRQARQALRAPNKTE
jgi:hypothetical protein